MLPLAALGINGSIKNAANGSIFAAIGSISHWAIS
jgi:hypothetical protein